MPYIRDDETDLTEKDFLNSKVYSDTLIEILKTIPSGGSFTIGIFGEWGSGKSSIIKTASKELSKDKNVKVIFYDAWKYTNDSFRRTFLLKVSDELAIEKSSQFRSFYASRSEDTFVKRRLDTSFLSITAIIFLLVTIWILTLPAPWKDLTLSIGFLATSLGLIVNILSKAFVDLKQSQQQPVTFAVEQFEECFDEIVIASLRPVSENHTTKWVKKVPQQFEKLVFVIDNIDRCSKETALELLNNIKNFLGKEHDMAFIIPVDEFILKEHLKNNSSNTGQEVERYLRKIFNLTIRIKPFPHFDLYEFSQKINHLNKFNFTPTTVDIIAKEFVTNPRRIIQMFNNLEAELSMFRIAKSHEFAKEHESIICKMLIIREEWYDHYIKLSKRPVILQEPEPPDSDRPSELKIFLNITQSLTQNTEPHILDAIFSAKDRDVTIPSELLEAISNKSTAGLYAWMKNQKENENIAFEKLLEKLNKGINRNLFQTEVVNIFELLCFLDEKLLFSKYEFNRIFNESASYFASFIQYTTVPEAIIRFAGHASAHGFETLEQYISHTISENLLSDKSSLSTKITYRKWMVLFLENVGLQKHRDYVFHAFKTDLSVVKFLPEYNFTPETLRLVISEEMVLKIIDGIEYLFTTDASFNNIVYLSSNVPLSKKELEHFVSWVNRLHPATTNYSHEDMITLISSINIVLRNQHVKVHSNSNENSLNILFEKFIGRRTMHGTSYNIIQETNSSEEENTLLDLLFNIFRLCDPLIDIKPKIKEILSRSPSNFEYVHQKIAELPSQFNKEYFSSLFEPFNGEQA